MISEDQAAGLILAALHIRPISLKRQALTQSGNAIFRAVLPSEQAVVMRVSPRRNTFAYTQHNLNALRELGLPVQTVRAAGSTESGGSFIILNWLAGRDLVYELAQMRPEQMTHLAQTITEYQKRVGNLPQSRGFGWAPIGKNAASARWTEVFGAPATAAVAIPAVPGNASPLERFRGRLRAVRQSVEPYFATIRPVCFLDDLTTKNILVEDGILRGIIDVDFVCYGDPLMSVGATLACIAAEVGGAGHFYGEELIRCWNPTSDALRAIRFYSALWTIGFLSAADAAGEKTRVAELEPIADAMLCLAEAQ